MIETYEDGNDEASYCCVIQRVPFGLASTIANTLQDVGVVQANTVRCNVAALLISELAISLT